VRRPTLIMIIVLFVLLIVTAIFQLTRHAPETPFPGPSSPGQLPPTPTR
jgi:hypothetical protein